MDMTSKKWVLTESYPADLDKVFSKYPRIIRQLFYNRHLFTKVDVEQFFNPVYEGKEYDPAKFRHMGKAIALIQAAIAVKDRITIFGDNDADGVCGSAIIAHVFQRLAVNFNVYLPHRENEGYGLNKKALDQLAKEGTKLLITVDCGISSLEEIAYANSLGLQVIITDHHEQLLPTPPPAAAIIHPLLAGETYPDKFLCGGGVAFKLAQALIKEYPEVFLNGFDRWILDLVAISTVADFGKLRGENRTLVKYGLIVLNKTRNVGLKKLYEIANLPRAGKLIDTQQIGFQIVPLINAAGRMNHASSAYKLLVTENEEEASIFAQELKAANTSRQRVTDEIYKEAMSQIGDQTEKDIIILYNKNWLTTVIGIVASRLSHYFNKPVAIIGKRGELWSGSARSVPQFHIAESLKRLAGYLDKYGGHAQAAGFTVKGEQLDKFIVAWEKDAREHLQHIVLEPEVVLEGEISLAEINEDLLNWLEKFKPFGVHNERPKFLLKQCEIGSCHLLGKNEAHLKLLVPKPNGQGHLKFVFFNAAVKWAEKLTTGKLFDAVVELDFNNWLGILEVQIKIIDVKID